MMASLKSNPNLDLNAIFKPFAFQKEAYEYIKDREYAGVFHEQGLGKTKIAIDLLLNWLAGDVIDSVIIVTKKGLVPNWLRELKTHTKINVKILGSNRNENFLYLNSHTSIYITHYETLIYENERLLLFQNTRRLGIILDESQKIKNPEAKISQAAFKLAPNFVRRLILTGTPIANRPFDIWAQVYFLDQGQSLGTDFASFKQRLDLPKNSNFSSSKTRLFEQYLAELFQKISKFCIRETKKGSKMGLPEKIIINLECEWEDNQYKMYQSVQQELYAEIVQNGQLIQDRSDNQLKRLLRLAQITSNPAIIDESYKYKPGKFDKLEALIHRISDNGEKAIIWSSFIKNINYLARLLKKFNPKRVHGSMNYEDRNNSITSFLENPKTEILIATPGAAKEGFTLTVANHVIFYDRSFNLDDYLQAQDRIHRISQKRTCYVHNLIIRDSIDEWIDVLIRAKTNAASLGLQDISIDEYRKITDYSFNDIVARIITPRNNRDKEYDNRRL